MPRKTFSIAKLLHSVNKKNENSTCSSMMRQGWNALLSEILIDADVYAGFNYLNDTEVPVGQRPGISFQDPHGNTLSAVAFFERLDATTEAERGLKADFKKGNGDRRVFPDDTRRFYYVCPDLLEAYSKIPNE
jgi:hypothetical protein